MSRDEENLDEPRLNDGAGADPTDPDQPGKPANKQPEGGTPDESDLLFEPPTPPADVTEEFGGRQQFSEGARTKWGGHGMDAEEIGIPIEGEPGYLSTDDDFALDSDQEMELEVVDDESQLDQPEAEHEQGADAEAPLEAEAEPEADAGAGDGDLVLEDDPAFAVGDAGEVTTEGEFFVLDEAERSGSLLRSEPLPADSYPVEEGWEPVGAEGETGGEWAGGEAGAVPAHAEVERLNLDRGLDSTTNDELEEQYYEEAGTAVIAAAPRRRGRVMRMLASTAAAAMVVGAGAVVVLRPEWLGLHFEPQLVARVQVARPNVELLVPTPLPPAVQAVAPVPPPIEVVRVDPPKDPGPTNPTPTDPVAVVPTPADPTPTDPVAVGGPDPIAADPAPVVPTGSQPVAEVPRYLPVGDSLWIGDFDGRQRNVAEWAQVRLGAKAFAQLQNGNYFIGSVKAVNSDALILTVPAGEVTLLRGEIEKVATLDSQEYAELQQATTGFLRLSNRNRLVGAILKSVVDDNYVLQMRSDRIVVPRSAVEQVVAQPGMDGLRFSAANDEDEWLRGVASQQLRAMATGAPATPSGESRRATQAVPPGNAKGAKLLPIKEVGRKVPTDRKDGK